MELQVKNRFDEYDTYLDATYSIVSINAKELKTYLLANLKTYKINPDDFRGSGGVFSDKNPPVEIYEYQMFSILKREDGEYVLLDGFRRLIWYDAPDMQILVRVYYETNLTKVQIMKLLVYFNHFKFYLGGNYYDRGFGLAMRTIFHLSIPKYLKTFDGYLTKSETVRKYWRESTGDDGDLNNVKTRLTNPMFVSDMIFIESLLNKDVVLNEMTGALIYQYRALYPDQKFSSEFFLDKCNNPIIKEQFEKYKKAGDNTSVKSQDALNRIFPLYENIFKDMFGAETIKTYAEKLAEAKLVLAELKKDKSLIKVTGNKSTYLINFVIAKRLKEGKSTKFKCVIYPLEENVYSHRREKIVEIPHGLLDKEITITFEPRRSSGKNEMVMSFTNDNGKKIELAHNYGDTWGNGGTKYTKISYYTDDGVFSHVEQKIDLFADVTKAEMDYVDKNRNF